MSDQQATKNPNTPDRMPEVGDDVLFVLGANSRNAGQVRPAKVVRVWTPTQATAQLVVFVDGMNDGFAEQAVWETSVPYSRDKTQRTWHYKGE